MSLDKIHLRKLLQLMYAPDAKRIALLRTDIRNELSKEESEDEEEGKDGGDFYVPFWADAKEHAAGHLDLIRSTASRIESNRGRARLYPRLRDGFLKWWNLRRGVNEPLTFIRQSVKKQFLIEELRTIVKIENILALKLGDHSHRIVYPYFSEVPSLPPDGARLALWLLNEAFNEYAAEDWRVLDVMRGTAFSTADIKILGNERQLFIAKYKQLIEERKRLKREY